MSARSQNGWPAYADTSRFTRFTAAGRGWWAANADVAVVFTEFVERFNRDVEPVIVPGEEYDDWSHAYRDVRDGDDLSNHASATALDINATRHPRGVRGTFTARQAQEMREIKNSITDAAGVPVLRLGMDYQGTVDDMHVEINASAARVKEAANKIRKAKLAMALTKIDVDAFLDHQDELSESAAKVFGEKKGHKQSIRYMLTWGGARGAQTSQQLKDLGTDINALTTKLNDVAAAIATTKTEIAAVRALVAEALEESRSR